MRVVSATAAFGDPRSDDMLHREGPGPSLTRTPWFDTWDSLLEDILLMLVHTIVAVSW